MSGALLLSRSEVAALATPRDWLDAVREGFRAAASGDAQTPPPLHVAGDGRGGFHAKGAFYRHASGRTFAAVKLNANFPDNPVRFGRPTVAGAVLLFDAGNGELLAAMDSIEITLRRTAAASTLAALLLANPGTGTLLVCGCGALGRAHVEALRDALSFERLLLFDADVAKAAELAAAFSGEVAQDITTAARQSDIVVTCTTSTRPILSRADVRAGAFVAAIGADSAAKSEIDPNLLAEARIVTDSLEQCRSMGDLCSALVAGARIDDAVELGAVLVSTAPGRRKREEIVVYDSTGVAFQDAAAAVMIYERAHAANAARRFEFAA